MSLTLKSVAAKIEEAKRRDKEAIAQASAIVEAEAKRELLETLVEERELLIDRLQEVKETRRMLKEHSQHIKAFLSTLDELADEELDVVRLEELVDAASTLNNVMVLAIGDSASVAEIVSILSDDDPDTKEDAETYVVDGENCECCCAKAA